MKAFQVKYRGVFNGREAIEGSRNNPEGGCKYRTRKWQGPRGKSICGTGKQMARLQFDAQVRRALV